MQLMKLVEAHLVTPFIDSSDVRLGIDRDRPSVITTNFSDTEIKLAEAEFFLNLLTQNASHQAVILFALSAFLSAARSVTLLLQAEAAGKPGFDEWYRTAQDELKNDEVAKFLKDQRDIGVHAHYAKVQTIFDVPIYKDGDKWVYKPEEGIFAGFAFVDSIMDNGLERCSHFLDSLREVVQQAKERGFLPEENPRRVSLEARDLGKRRRFRS